MKLNPELVPWTGKLISAGIGGLFHGSLVGGGISVGGEAAGVSSLALLKGVALGCAAGALKDVALYVNKNQPPSFFIAAPEVEPTTQPQKNP